MDTGPYIEGGPRPMRRLSENAVQIGDAGCENQRQGVGRSVERADQAKRSAALHPGETNGFSDQLVGDRAGIHEVKCDQPCDFQTRGLIGRRDDPVQHQTAGSARVVPGEKGAAAALILKHGFQFLAPCGLVEPGVAEPCENQGIAKFRRLQWCYLDGHRVISAPPGAGRIDLAQRADACSL